jgi:hypothetical protein
MKKLFFVSVWMMLFSGATQAAPILKFPASLIPDSLKENANAVIRESLIEFTYVSPKKSVCRIRKVVTVLNKNGDSRALFRASYDKMNKVSLLKGIIYDANGKPIEKLDETDMNDVSGSYGQPEFEDIRLLWYQPLYSVYPYTAEYEYLVTMDGTYKFPQWDVYDYAYENVSVEKAGLVLRVPKGYQVNFRNFNVPRDQPMKETGEMYDMISWQVNQLKAFDAEPYEDNSMGYRPSVYTSPSNFELEGYTGNLSSWQNLGLWLRSLNEGRDELAPERIQEIRAMVGHLATNREKVKMLYNYLQSHTRYFSIQLGLGGLQPVDAKIVDEVGYGDCKGLSNYMKALLKAAGIESHYTLVESGEHFPQVISDFVYDPFNHIILCVPLEKDTIWLECTSQHIPFGFLGDFTSDRQVLLVTDEGGKLVHTPTYNLAENYQYTSAHATIDLDGNGVATIHRSFGGLQFDQKMGPLVASTTDQKEWLYRYWPMADFQISQFEFKASHEDLPASVLTSSVQLNHYATVSGKRLFLPLNMVNPFKSVPARVKQRRTNIRLTIAFVDADTVWYSLPVGTTLEFLPEPREILSPFGEYRARAEFKEGKIVYIREVRMNKGIFPKESYDTFIRFFNEMRVADKCQAILLKNGT